MDEQQQKIILRETFDTVAAGYDSKALRFFPDSARLLVEHLDLAGDERVLDVATGTGNTALALARLLPRGHVTGVDFSPSMLEQARAKAAAGKAGNIDFLEMDMQSLSFPGGTFDAATCSFAIFFVKDMEAQLAHMAAPVRAGGKIAISGFQNRLFGPLAEQFFRRLGDYGIKKPAEGWKRIATESGCRQLFGQAGLTDVRVDMKNVGYFLDSAEEWWDVVWNAGFRRLVSQLSPQKLEQFRLEHLNEIELLRSDEGIWLEVGVIFTIGTKQ